MDWTKIPTTIISKRYSDYEILSIVKFQLIWAMNEEQPNKTTALRYMTSKQYETAMTYLDSIAAMVCDEVSLVTRKRSAEKIRYSKNKDLKKILLTDCKQTVDSQQEQIREDNIKEEKYKFEGKVIKLNYKDYYSFSKEYPHIDLDRELEGLDRYYSENNITDWWMRCKNRLKTKEAKAKEESGWHVEGSNW
jgi:hypothetical protein